MEMRREAREMGRRHRVEADRRGTLQDRPLFAEVNCGGVDMRSLR